MSIAEAVEPLSSTPDRALAVEVVVPVHNEERDLETSIRRLRRYLDTSFPLRVLVTIADNASTDRTWPIAEYLEGQLRGVRAVHLGEKGRGRALRSVWSDSEAEVVAYMDVDLSTGLDALLPLIAPLISGHSDVAIGSRLAAGARVVRGPKREVVSRCYNLVVKAALGTRISDAQCGFKALRADVAKALLPLVEDDGWFFDTELLVLAERNGLRIHEVAVDWVDDADSRVDIVKTAAADLRGIWRLVRELGEGRGRAELNGRRPLPGSELASFARIGVFSTICWVTLWLALRPALGAFVANAVALVVCTVANTVANGRLTFSARAPFRARDQVLGSAAAFGASLAATSLALLGAEVLGTTSAAAELGALLTANGLVGLGRFVLLRAWAFRTHSRRQTTTEALGTGLVSQVGR
jgi:glycosyltransferase involved in cell wall biosynthesis/putative flippase GtrA